MCTQQDTCMQTRSSGVDDNSARVLAISYPHRALDAKHTTTGFYNLVISTNRCERNSYVKLGARSIRGLKSFACATRLFPPLRDALQLVERDFVRLPPTGGSSCTGGRSYVRARPSKPSSLGWAGGYRTGQKEDGPHQTRADPSGPHSNVEEPPGNCPSP